jgi:transcription antitermination factor NusA-like protein
METTTKVLDMQFIRYANLFYNVTRIRSKHCFEYNHTIVFVVPKHLVMRSIGQDNRNLEKLSSIIGKKIKIVADPNGINDIKNFLSVITKPVRFNSIDIVDDEVVINAGNQNKASLIGRDKVRLGEMSNIIEQYFGYKKVRIK